MLFVFAKTSDRTLKLGDATLMMAAEKDSEAFVPGSVPASNQNDDAPKEPRTFTFWAVIIALCITSLLAALENTVVATSLPFIVDRLRIGKNFVWITNGFFLARYIHIPFPQRAVLNEINSAAIQPLFGQLANIFGRRWLAVFIVAIFTVGSAVCGAANNGATLIAGRCLQGIGSGGINVISDIIISDLVPLRERGNFIAIILAVYSIGTSLGPFIGGILVEKSSWRWVFLITIPFGALAISLLVLFLHVKSPKITIKDGLSKIDTIGNTIVVLSSLSTLFALSYADSPYSWTTWHVLVPLILGIIGLIILGLFETSRFCKFPIVPATLFRNRTAAIVYINTFINSMLLYWVMFFLPIYFEAVLGSSPARTGVQLLPIVLIAVPGAVLAVVILSKYGRYRPLHQAGFAIATVGVGLFVRLNAESSTVEWVIYQVIAGLGSGMILNTLLPAFQAAHKEDEQAMATASWAFIRSIGNIWGVAIPAAVFNNRVQLSLDHISNASIRELIADGKAYQIGPSISRVLGDAQGRLEVAGVYADALKIVWAVGAGFGLLGFVLSLAEKEIHLRTELETEYGLEER